MHVLSTPVVAIMMAAGLTIAMGQPAAFGATGGFEVAFQANTGNLYTYSSVSGTANLSQGMKAGTSPAIAALPGGGYEEAFQANTGNLIVYGSAGNKNTEQGMKAGTSPAIAASPGGGFEVAFQANTGNLYTYSSVSGTANLSQGMKAGTSPAIATSASDGSETKAETAAVNWAESMVGSASGQSGGQYWYGCLAFAINAYQLGASFPIRNDISITVGSDTYPSEVWGHFLSGTTGTGNTPPPGALVFWDSTGGTADSHVAISIGNGTLVSTNVDQSSVPGYNGIHYETMTQFAQNSWNIYKGWWLPDG